MAFLGMPAGQQEVKADDFILWADRYIRLPGKEQISGLEFYGARCAMLHTYGTASKISRQGRVRQIGYMNRAVPEVIPSQDQPDVLVLVSIAALRDSLFAGIDRYLVDLFADKNRASVAESRLNLLVTAFNYRPSSEVAS